MKLKIIIIIAIIFTSTVFSQKVELSKSNFVLIDKKDWMKFNTDSADDLSLVNNSNATLIVIRSLRKVSVDLQSEINPEGFLYYANIKFPTLNKEFEIQMNKEEVLLLLFKSKVITNNGELDVSIVELLLKKHREIYSAK